MTPLGRRLYKLSFLSGLFLTAPLLVGTLWYAWSAYANLDRYRRAFDAAHPQAIDPELFQIALHDQLMSDVRRLRQPERPAHGQLPTFSLSLSRDSLDELSKASHYGKGLLEKDGRVHEVSVRYRGDQPWHVVGEQKSLKIRLSRGDLVDGVRIFNLLNDPTPFGLEDQIILDLAREQGLLTPEYHPVRLRVNNHDMGVYRFEAQPDETLLRRGRRTPGNMYSGDTDERGTSLFASTEGWQKIASRTVAEKDEHPELDRLIGAVNDASHRAFAEYARDELDLDRYATFDALDVIFCGSEHDYFSNHKLYADPYRGRLEPVAWSFRGFQHEDTFNVIDHPLLIRLKMTPGYLALRDRAVYRLLTGRASVPAIRERVDRAVGPLAPELAADPYWDAYKQLPRVSRFHRFYVRPMTLDRWWLSARYELDVFAVRSRYLLDALEQPGLEVRRMDLGKTAHGDRVARIDLTVSGHAAYVVRGVRTAAECHGQLTIHADADLDGAFDPTHDIAIVKTSFGEGARVTAYRELVPRVRLVPHPDPKPKRGRLRVETEPTTFTYFAVASECNPSDASLLLESSVVGSDMKIDMSAVPLEPGPPARTSSVSAERVPRLVLGERSPHPWSFPQPPAPRRVVLGPGVVPIATTRIFGERDTVEIAPGTTLALGSGASLVFRGRVTARGTPGRPIRLTRLDPERPFGGIALQGPRTSGSRLSEVHVDGGSRVREGKIDYTAVVNVHDTSNVTLEDWTITGDVDSADVIHANTVRGLSLDEISVRDAPVDAVDLEFVTGSIRNLFIAGAGDDCLDLMGTTLQLQDALIIGCVHNGISAGEESEVTANRIVIARAKTGVLSKNASEVRLLRSLLYQDQRGLRARRKQIRYGGPSRIGLSEVFVVGSDVVQDSDKGSTIEVEQLRVEMPEGADLPHVLDQVLRIRAWSELDARMTSLAPGSAR